MRRYVLATLTLLLVFAMVPVLGEHFAGAQQAYADDAFQVTRDRLDLPVENGEAVRTWFWGPEPISEGLYEPYTESPNGERLVQYIDKARFELNQPDADPNDAWYVSTGLLTRELISGSVQTGDGSYELREPSTAAMAGDATNTWPTYAGFERVIDQMYTDMTGQHATSALLVSGVTTYADASNDPGAEIVEYITYDGPDGPVGYNVPAAFWEFMNAAGLVWEGEEYVQADPLIDWVFVLGLPISDPFWASVELDGEPTWVLIQAFERRLLTYTPDNPEGWQVEMGNVGRHYYEWRYSDDTPGTPAPEPTPTTPTPTTPTTPTPVVPVTPSPPAMPIPGGDGPSSDIFAMRPNNSWTYQDVDTGELYEVEIPGRTEDFIEGESLYIRRETRPDGTVELSYWKTSETILWLYGREIYDAEGDRQDRYVYDPAIRYITTALDLGEGWGTNSHLIWNGTPVGLYQFAFLVTIQREIGLPAGVFETSLIRATIAPTDGDNLTGPAVEAGAFDFAPYYGIVRHERDDGVRLELVAYDLD